MKYLFTLLILAGSLFAHARQTGDKTVYTVDIDHFWTAYDSVKTTTDTLKQQDIIQRLYIDNGTEGLKAFMKARNYDAKLWVQLIHKYPRFWESIRKNTLMVKDFGGQIEQSIQQFKQLYPEMKPAKMYFTIGGLRSGGTTSGNMVLVGAEIASADKATDASELSDWLKGVFQHQDISNIVGLNVHEYVHTQQKTDGPTYLVDQCVMEGAADFIAELVTRKENKNSYVIYGKAHEPELKAAFKAEMFGKGTGNWLYNGSNSKTQADLGYFMGYAICKSYYTHAKNKKLAIKNIIELDYANEAQVTRFLADAQYYAEGIDRPALVAAYEAKQPVVTGFLPVIGTATILPTNTTELTILFSEPMGDGVSISYGESGKEHFPITGIIGFAQDKKSIKLKIALQPGRAYDFLITGRSFKSLNGYPLKEYPVRFSADAK